MEVAKRDERAGTDKLAWGNLASCEAAYRPFQGIHKEMGPSPNRSIQSQVQGRTCLNGGTDLEASGGGSFVGVENQVGSSFRGWRIDEERMGSVAEAPQMGCCPVAGIRRAREADVLELPEEGTVRGSPDRRAYLVGNRHG